jgi:hypothetical protein
MIDEEKTFLGEKFYLKVIENNNRSKFKDICIRATKRYIDIFLRPKADEFVKSNTEMKIKNWVRVSKNLLKLKNHSLTSIIIQFEEINGRMKSLNIL